MKEAHEARLGLRWHEARVLLATWRGGFHSPCRLLSAPRLRSMKLENAVCLIQDQMESVRANTISVSNSHVTCEEKGGGISGWPVLQLKGKPKWSRKPGSEIWHVLCSLPVRFWFCSGEHNFGQKSKLLTWRLLQDLLEIQERAASVFAVLESWMYQVFS